MKITGSLINHILIIKFFYPSLQKFSRFLPTHLKFKQKIIIFIYKRSLNTIILFLYLFMYPLDSNLNVFIIISIFLDILLKLRPTVRSLFSIILSIYFSRFVFIFTYFQFIIFLSPDFDMILLIRIDTIQRIYSFC